MKTKAFGEIRFTDRIFGNGANQRRDVTNVCALAYLDYMNNRMNGANGDSPWTRVSNDPLYAQLQFPRSGTYRWIHGGIDSKGAYGERIDGKMVYEVRYIPSLADEEWMRKRDEDYLDRIARSGDLQRLEPEEWAKRERARLTADRAAGRPIVGLAALLETLGIRGEAAAKAIREADTTAVIAALDRIQAANPRQAPR